MFGTRVSAFLKLSKRDLKYDLPASVVVFLVALPLCLGIAMASGAPLFAGLLTGIIGGIVVASFSGSQLSVSGPAAGLTVIVLGAIEQLGAYETFLLAVVIAGLIQVVLGIIKAGMIGNYFPSAVIIGMLAAIGITIILKQLPHAVGYDSAFFGEESFAQRDQDNTFTALQKAFDAINYGAFIICAVSLAILILWPKFKKLKSVPAPLVVVVVGVALSQAFLGSDLALGSDHLVTIPVVQSFGEFVGLFTFPDFTQILNKDVWVIAFTIAIIASLETLLSIEAVDKIDPFKRNSPTNRELLAQGIGNTTSGLLGGIPMTSVIVRSSANVNSGGRTRQSAILHGIWLLLAVIIIPGIINLIPLSCLAAILLHTGYKLAKGEIFKQMWHKGLDQFIPFIVTIVAVVLTDLLTGVGIGLLVAMFYILRNSLSNAFEYDVEENEDGAKITFTLAEEVTFLNKAAIQKALYSLPRRINEIVIDGSHSRFIDKDVIEVIKDFEQNAVSKGKTIELVGIVNKKNVPNIKRFTQSILKNDSLKRKPIKQPSETIAK
ncbi:SulP family inorganic anion transporter [Parapedobacter koreensis]|uniref:Carbonic anhydrase/sulfate permease, SulP family n=1 Tax=Parapedobacter koreensis TaxID=332977 RepID=A0A1H7RME0_9SPHI|nr:SulP family inorganic anion transporter [Parapedobacter koreensis]SEL61332.1 carbonic anhydrase/sulfate permease, SulP family [Parapedobacter koreensis]